MTSTMAEIVYGTKEEGHVMSDKVSQLATSVYSEFERMIKRYDEDVVKELMPLIVGILESLDQSFTEKQESEVDQELLREDNEQLLTQYEREKQLRKGADQKLLEMEDTNEEQMKETEEKLESLESIVRMLELKNRNATDHLSRMEDKESELKKEYNKIHERYTELMRTHMDYMERAKILMGTDRLADMANSPRSRGGFHLPNLKPVNMANLMGSTPLKSAGSPPDASSFDLESPRSGKDSNISLRSELSDIESPDATSKPARKVTLATRMSDKGQTTDKVDVCESATATKLSKISGGRGKPDSSEEAKSEDTEPRNTSSTNAPDNIVITVSSVDDNVFIENQDLAIESHSRNDKHEECSKSLRKVSDIKSTESTTTIVDSSESVIEKHDLREEKSAELPDKRVAAKETLKRTSYHKTSESGLTPKFPISPLESPEYDDDYMFCNHNMSGLDRTLEHIVATTPELHSMVESVESDGSMLTSGTGRTTRNGTSIFDEIHIQDEDLVGDVDYGADITGRVVNPADYASSDSEDEREERNSTVSDNFFGMGRELENLILENTELLATKNALNIVKDDLIAKVDELTSEQEILREEITSLQCVKSKFQGRIKDLEEEVKKTKEELEKKNQAAQEQESEDDVPMAQRKRFTRVEMARVLMERNQYKERLMELQEAVRWTEMIRASREHPEIAQSKKKSSIWNFFSNLFASNSPNKPNKRPLPIAMVKYSAPTTNVQPVGDPNQKQRGKYNLGDKSKAYDFLQDDLNKSLEDPVLTQPTTSEKAKKEREKERKEQYKQVRAHVKKDDGRMQAYGWSLPAKFQPQIPNAAPAKTSVPVPVPVYCRPLLEETTGVKIWCAAGVDLTGGRTWDGGSIVGASVFYSNPPEFETPGRTDNKDEVDRLNKELKDHENNVRKSETEQLSSFVWICTSTHTKSCVSVIDANNPGDILETFRVSTTPVLCISSVPGALESDYTVDEDILNAESYPQHPESADISLNNSNVSEESGIGGISFVQCDTGVSTGGGSRPVTPTGSHPGSRDVSPSRANITAAVTEALSNQGGETIQPTVFKAKGSPVSSGAATPDMSRVERRILHHPSGLVKDGLNALASGSNLQDEEVEKMSSMQPTMWIGAQSGSLHVHSSVAQWRRCLHSVKLRDSILNIVHLKGRVLAALADGTVAIFHRDTDGQWDLENYHLLDLGRPHHSIRCMSVIANKHVWCGYRNKVHVVDPQSMTITKTFDAHPRKESQVRQLAWVGDGVWVSIRLDSTLRLYHAYTHQHLQDVDIEPYVSKMLGTGKLGFSFVRITSMMISCNRLWIGTGNGVIISVPLSENNKQAMSMGTSTGRPGGIVRVYSDTRTDSVTPGSFIPYCTMAQAQLSFHGHRDAVKFFVAVPGKKRRGMSAAVTPAEEESDKSTSESDMSGTRLVISGGEGYVDFRIGDGDEEIIEVEEEEKKASLSKGERSHLIVWEVSTPE